MLSRPAAIKLIRPDALARAGRSSEEDAARIVRRFEREVQATALLGSPHTIQIYDFGVTAEGTFYYVMEFLKGLDLQTLVERFGPLESERVVCMLCQVCHSLRDAHAASLIHRDIKPANIFACSQGQDFDFMKVLDFGLVKDVSGQRQETQLTTEGLASGTPAYMAPETVYGKRPVDARADIYALGCVAWWLLTGRPVFEANTPMEMVLKHVNEQPEPPSRYTEIAVPGEMDRFVLSCLEKEPGGRPQTAGEAMKILESIGCAGREWTPERAEEWWKTNLSDLLALESDQAETAPAKSGLEAPTLVAPEVD
jgi:serine/threonine-protein kinase